MSIRMNSMNGPQSSRGDGRPAASRVRPEYRDRHRSLSVTVQYFISLMRIVFLPLEPAVSSQTTGTSKSHTAR
ncbi:hypothetical protein FA95DRAFT_902360 [Auriscalpium vulgare]|uniref:Uncharacterized protein n=1 Tax=Auriscalpium vulgare TaxID=40419 RepID=A0ACB8R8P5_9AGAM|nr:hypothetical protein FA95DRAFT_902360 [Auriscalpium vulgare]